MRNSGRILKTNMQSSLPVNETDKRIKTLPGKPWNKMQKASCDSGEVTINKTLPAPIESAMFYLFCVEEMVDMIHPPQCAAEFKY